MCSEDSQSRNPLSHWLCCCSHTEHCQEWGYFEAVRMPWCSRDFEEWRAHCQSGDLASYLADVWPCVCVCRCVYNERKNMPTQWEREHYWNSYYIIMLPHSKWYSAKLALRVGLIRTAKMHEYLISLHSMYEPRPWRKFCAVAHWTR